MISCGWKARSIIITTASRIYQGLPRLYCLLLFGFSRALASLWYSRRINDIQTKGNKIAAGKRKTTTEHTNIGFSFPSSCLSFKILLFLFFWYFEAYFLLQGCYQLLQTNYHLAAALEKKKVIDDRRYNILRFGVGLKLDRRSK